MAAPEGCATSGESRASDDLPAPPAFEASKPGIIRKRRDFLAAAKARRAGVGSMMVQGRERRSGETPPPGAVRVGYTCSKKVGNAVRRNRAKRRLRAAAAEVLPRLGRPGWDYVLIGRAAETEARVFADLLRDLEKALHRIHEVRR